MSEFTFKIGHLTGSSERKITETITDIGVAAIQAEACTPSEFASAMGVSLNMFAVLVSKQANVSVDIVRRGLQKSFELGLNINIECTEAAGKIDEPTHVQEPPKHGIDLASLQPPAGKYH